MLEIVAVKINGKGKIYHFKNENLKLRKNCTVIVDTDKGLQYGQVVDFIKEEKNLDINELKNVIRLTTKKDYIQHLTNIKDAEKAIVKCKEMINKNNLNMSLVDAEYTFTRSQLIFKFISDERVDFRQLAKELGSYFKTRIELRQVGIRDKAKEIGGVGLCGRKLCCASFLKEFESVSINMAKNQSIALNPTKINGVCGRLLCCLKYENENYSECRKKLPEVGKFVDTDEGSSKVISLDILNEKYTVVTPKNNIKEVDVKNGSKE